MVQEKQQEKISEILLFALVGVGLIGYLDAFASLPYFWKASGKMLLFLGVPLVYGKIHPDVSYKALFRLEKKPLKIAFALAIGVFSVILGSYFVLGDLVDLSAVTVEMEKKLSIDAENFVIVALYIALCNSFLEEFFFRGFLFFRLKEAGRVAFAHGASAVIFSLYHVAIMVTWFQWWVFALCMIALVVGGVLFNLLDLSTESLYPSWLTHMFANFALNTIGMILFYL